MITVLLLILGCLILIWQLLNALLAYKYKNQELLLTQGKNYKMINLYKTFRQSIMALNIQLRVAQKLWTINPIQSQNSLFGAYQLSSDIMQDLRQIVRIIDEQQPCNLDINYEYFDNQKSKIKIL